MLGHEPFMEKHETVTILLLLVFIAAPAVGDDFELEANKTNTSPSPQFSQTIGKNQSASSNDEEDSSQVLDDGSHYDVTKLYSKCFGKNMYPHGAGDCANCSLLCHSKNKEDRDLLQDFVDKKYCTCETTTQAQAQTLTQSNEEQLYVLFIVVPLLSVPVAIFLAYVIFYIAILYVCKDPNRCRARARQFLICLGKCLHPLCLKKLIRMRKFPALWRIAILRPVEANGPNDDGAPNPIGTNYVARPVSAIQDPDQIPLNHLGRPPMEVVDDEEEV